MLPPLLQEIDKLTSETPNFLLLENHPFYHLSWISFSSLTSLLEFIDLQCLYNLPNQESTR